MAGTDFKQHPPKLSHPAPVIILIGAQLGENIGMTARAMLNCGLTELRLVNPKEGWPNAKALSASSGATEVIKNAQLYNSTAEAIADLNYLIGTTARPRDMSKPMLPVDTAIDTILEKKTAKCGLVFGCERVGLHNDDATLCDALLTIPLNPGFSSLNLAQAVLLVGYNWFSKACLLPPKLETISEKSPLAPKKELINFFERLENELDETGFLRAKEKRPTMVQNIRNIFLKADLTQQEVNTLHGIVKSLKS
ncbi:MAG: RNA methyltransferase [Alphaproteobacteria bacterium]